MSGYAPLIEEMVSGVSVLDSNSVSGAIDAEETNITVGVQYYFDDYPADVIPADTALTVDLQVA